MNDLVISEKTTALEVYCCDSAEAIVGKIESEVRSFVPDLSTATGRKEIASLAYRVSQSKTALDGLGKDLVTDWKSKSKAVDNERKMIRDRLDALRDEVRKPLTDWEEAEKARIEGERLAKDVADAYDFAVMENELFDRNFEIERIAAEKLEIAEAERVEVERKEVEEARIKREAQIAKDAAEQAIANERESAAKERAEQERKVAEAKASEERAKREQLEAEKAAEQRRINDVAASEKAAKDAADAKESARVAEEKRISDEDAARAKDKENRRKVNNAILEAMLSAGIGDKEGKAFIKLVLSGSVENMMIKY
jgi:colicin import membrane protein